jgi:hypothetical protein
MPSLLGSKPNQVSTNGELGTMAFREQDQFLELAGTQTVSGAKTFSEIITASKGVAFPATQVASADANTLDDYEEGTWTPAYSASVLGTFSASYTEQIGFYTKIGNTVYASFRIAGTVTRGTSSGDFVITGLPFTGVSGFDTFTGYIGFMGSVLPSSPIGLLNASSSTFTYIGIAAGGSLNVSAIPTGATSYQVRGTIIYRTTS